MTPQKHHIKVLKPFYGKAEGYDHTNAIVAFGKTDEVRGTKGFKGKRKKRRL